MDFRKGVLAISLLSLSYGAFASSANDAVRVIIKYKQTMAVSLLQAQITKATQLPVKELKPMANGAYSLTLDTSQASLTLNKEQDATALVLEQLRKNPNVLYAVKDRIGHFRPVPDPIVSKSLSSLLS